MQAEAQTMEGGSEATATPKGGGKTRLLSLEDLDRRTRAYQKTAELIDRVEADLGGAERLSTAEQQIIRRAALTGAVLEDLGTRWLNGEPIDCGLFATLSNSERRLYESVGLRRQPRDVTPTLPQYLARKFGPAATEQPTKAEALTGGLPIDSGGPA
jgi:hypothetical protein